MSICDENIKFRLAGPGRGARRRLHDRDTARATSLRRYFDGLATDWEMIDYKVDAARRAGRSRGDARTTARGATRRPARWSTRRRSISGASRTARRSSSTNTSTPRRCMPRRPCDVARKATGMTDLNNRPGGPNLIVTAKTAHKVHFLDAATLTMQSTIDMPGSTHELALVGGRPHRLRHGLWRRRVRQARQSRPPHRRDRPAVEVAHARHRPRRDLCAARRDDGRAAARCGRRASSAMRCWRSIPRATR